VSHGGGGERIVYRSVRNAPQGTPLLFDCVYRRANVSTRDEPPPYEGALLPVNPLPYAAKPGPDMKAFCINRHHGGVNGLFLDASVRKVGLKGLWTLKWSPDFWTEGLWTTDGGVLPEDWPPWMRGFKDYGTPKLEMRQR